MSRNQRRRQARKKKKIDLKKQNKTKKVSLFDIFKSKFTVNNFNKILKSKKINTLNKVKKIKTLSISSILADIKKYIKLNRTTAILFTSMLAICIVGYFAVVYETDEEKNMRISENNKTVSIDLAGNDELYNSNLSEEVSNITNREENVVELVLEDESTIIEEVVVVEESEVTEAIEATDEVLDTDESEVTEEPEVTEEVLVTEEPVIAKREINVIARVDNSNKFDNEFVSVSESIKLGIDMYAILVEDKEAAYLETEAQAESVLTQLEARYRAEDVVEERIIFSENVEIKKVKRDIFDFDEIQTEEEVLEYIIKGTNEQRIHKVVSGENFWVIAHAYGLNTQDLVDANPDIDEKRLQIGTELSLIVAEPIINVVTIVIEERRDEIPYGREDNIKTDQYYVGEYRTKRSGVLGEADLVVEKYSENGKLIGEKILETSIIKEPVNKIVYEGTKPAPPRIGTGTLDRPTSRGYITSSFGPRWGSFHNGLDIGIPTGTEVYAADGGVVINSGWNGTYGKLVTIDHGANTKTYYAHNSVLVVGAGERVFKGQLIAYSGSTGRSTGPHLHFEIRINNVPVNPAKYVKY